eukprot:8919411-Ditylum_brightwellii.AAC.1
MMGHSCLKDLFRMHLMTSSFGIVPSVIVSVVLGMVYTVTMMLMVSVGTTYCNSGVSYWCPCYQTVAGVNGSS